MTTENSNHGLAVSQTDDDVEARTATDVYHVYAEAYGEEACDLALNEFWDMATIVEMLLHRLSASEMDEYLNDMLGDPQPLQPAGESITGEQSVDRVDWQHEGL